MIVLPGYSRPLVRVSDYLDLLERSTYDGDRVRWCRLMSCARWASPFSGVNGTRLSLDRGIFTPSKGLTVGRMELSGRVSEQLPTASTGTTAWTVRFSIRGIDGVHHKVFRDRGAAEKFADWWRQRGDSYDAFVLPAGR